MGESLRDTDWMEQANCHGLDPDIFFPEQNYNRPEIIQVCEGCQVREKCLAYALDNNITKGVWGGYSERERRRMRQRRRLTGGD